MNDFIFGNVRQQNVHTPKAGQTSKGSGELEFELFRMERLTRCCPMWLFSLAMSIVVVSLRIKEGGMTPFGSYVDYVDQLVLTLFTPKMLEKLNSILADAFTTSHLVECGHALFIFILVGIYYVSFWISLALILYPIIIILSIFTAIRRPSYYLDGDNIKINHYQPIYLKPWKATLWRMGNIVNHFPTSFEELCDFTPPPGGWIADTERFFYDVFCGILNILFFIRLSIMLVIDYIIHIDFQSKLYHLARDKNGDLQWYLFYLRNCPEPFVWFKHCKTQIRDCIISQMVMFYQMAREDFSPSYQLRTSIKYYSPHQEYMRKLAGTQSYDDELNAIDPKAFLSVDREVSIERRKELAAAAMMKKDSRVKPCGQPPEEDSQPQFKQFSGNGHSLKNQDSGEDKQGTPQEKQEQHTEIIPLSKETKDWFAEWKKDNEYSIETQIAPNPENLQSVPQQKEFSEKSVKEEEEMTKPEVDFESYQPKYIDISDVSINDFEMDNGGDLYSDLLCGEPGTSTLSFSVDNRFPIHIPNGTNNSEDEDDTSLGTIKEDARDSDSLEFIQMSQEDKITDDSSLNDDSVHNKNPTPSGTVTSDQDAGNISNITQKPIPTREHLPRQTHALGPRPATFDAIRRHQQQLIDEGSIFDKRIIQESIDAARMARMQMWDSGNTYNDEFGLYRGMYTIKTRLHVYDNKECLKTFAKQKSTSVIYPFDRYKEKAIIHVMNFEKVKSEELQDKEWRHIAFIRCEQNGKTIDGWVIFNQNIKTSRLDRSYRQEYVKFQQLKSYEVQNDGFYSRPKGRYLPDHDVHMRNFVAGAKTAKAARHYDIITQELNDAGFWMLDAAPPGECLTEAIQRTLLREVAWAPSVSKLRHMVLEELLANQNWWIQYFFDFELDSFTKAIDALSRDNVWTPHMIHVISECLGIDIAYTFREDMDEKAPRMAATSIIRCGALRTQKMPIARITLLLSGVHNNNTFGQTFKRDEVFYKATHVCGLVRPDYKVPKNDDRFRTNTIDLILGILSGDEFTLDLYDEHKGSKTWMNVARMRGMITAYYGQVGYTEVLNLCKQNPKVEVNKHGKNYFARIKDGIGTVFVDEIMRNKVTKMPEKLWMAVDDIDEFREVVKGEKELKCEYYNKPAFIATTNAPKALYKLRIKPVEGCIAKANGAGRYYVTKFVAIDRLMYVAGQNKYVDFESNTEVPHCGGPLSCPTPSIAGFLNLFRRGWCPCRRTILTEEIALLDGGYDEQTLEPYIALDLQEENDDEDVIDVSGTTPAGDIKQPEFGPVADSVDSEDSQDLQEESDPESSPPPGDETTDFFTDIYNYLSESMIPENDIQTLRPRERDRALIKGYSKEQRENPRLVKDEIDVGRLPAVMDESFGGNRFLVNGWPNAAVADQYRAMFGDEPILSNAHEIRKCSAHSSCPDKYKRENRMNRYCSAHGTTLSLGTQVNMVQGHNAETIALVNACTAARNEEVANFRFSQVG